jgi:hypothetical protein
VRTFVDAVEDKSLLASLSADEQKRQNVILELITTEKQYVNDLRTLIEVPLPRSHQTLHLSECLTVIVVCVACCVCDDVL